MYDNLLSSNQYMEDYAPLNIIILCVVAGIIGLVLTGFTLWHIWLCARGQTTIECLEKTRYLSGVRSRVEKNRIDNLHTSHHRTNSSDLSGRVKRAGEQLLEFHANAIPGASRYEEGEEHTSPTPSVRHPARIDMEAPSQYRDHPTAYNHTDDATPAVRALRRSYHQTQSSYEHDREADRYEEYLDDRESEKLPNAFDLGWKRNLRHLLGPNPWFWGLPFPNTTGDGWKWEVSEKWARARGEMDQRHSSRDPQYGAQQQGPYGHLRGGVGGYDGADEHEYDREAYRPDAGTDEFGRGAVSMQTLNSQGENASVEGRVWGGRYRKDVDRSGENGEAESFEVSSDDDNDAVPGTGVQRGWSRDDWE